MECLLSADTVAKVAAFPPDGQKQANIRIQTAGFVNQYSLFTLYPGKMFFAPGSKIFLQQYLP
jgi:hypothetical protein